MMRNSRLEPRHPVRRTRQGAEGTRWGELWREETAEGCIAGTTGVIERVTHHVHPTERSRGGHHRPERPVAVQTAMVAATDARSPIVGRAAAR